MAKCKFCKSEDFEKVYIYRESHRDMADKLFYRLTCCDKVISEFEY